MDRKFLLLKRHEWTIGLTDEEIGAIAEDCQLVEVESGHILHHRGDEIDSVYLIVQGRLEQTFFDSRGNEVLRNFLFSGSTFGVLASAQMMPAPVSVVAVESTTFLKLNYDQVLVWSAKIPRLLSNSFRIVGNMMKHASRMERIRPRPGVVMILHDSPATRPLASRLIARLQELGEHPSLLTDDPVWESQQDTPHLLLEQRGRWLSDDEIRHKIGQWSAHERVFIDVAAAMDLDRLVQGIAIAERILLCVPCDHWQRAAQCLEKLRAREPGWREKINLVWFMEGEQKHAPQAPHLRDMVDYEFKVSLAEAPRNFGTLLNRGVERIVHELRGIRLGVALGGGAARGMAHLGVLKALEQHGITVDMIAGTSAGAMTGTLYASGMDVDYLVDCFVRDLTPSWLFRTLPQGQYWYLLYKYRRRHFDPMLRKYLADLRLDQLPLPMNTITVDLVTGQPVIRDRSDATRAIVESINLPGLSRPICGNGQALVDGGLVDNIPADVLVDKGCNFVIAVSVTAHLEHEFAKIRPDTPGPQHKSPSAVQTIMRGYVVQSHNMNSVGVQPADLVLDLDVTNFGLSEFTRTDELAAVGAETTINSLDKIRTALAQVDERLFASTT